MAGSARARLRRLEERLSGTVTASATFRCYVERGWPRFRERVLAYLGLHPEKTLADVERAWNWHHSRTPIERGHVAARVVVGLEPLTADVRHGLLWMLALEAQEGISDDTLRRYVSTYLLGVYNRIEDPDSLGAALRDLAAASGRDAAVQVWTDLVSPVLAVLEHAKPEIAARSRRDLLAAAGDVLADVQAADAGDESEVYDDER